MSTANLKDIKSAIKESFESNTYNSDDTSSGYDMYLSDGSEISCSELC